MYLKVKKEKKLHLSISEAPLISIITVVYNGEEFLEDTIQSVLNQDYKNIEYIIIDGGSTDSSVDIIKKYDSQIAYWVSEPDQGIYDAMNKGIKYSTGEIIGMINADDYYLPNAFQTLASTMIASEADIFYGCLNLIHRKSSEVLKVLEGNKDWKLYFKMSIPHPTTFVKREVYENDLYPTKYDIAGDYFFTLKSKLNKKKFEYINCLFVNMRDGGVSNTNKIVAKAETKAIKKELLGVFDYLSEFLILISLMVRKVKLLFGMI